MLEISWESEDGTSQTIDFDASVTESYEGNATVTEHPVEVGASITDHVRAENESISLEAIVTNTPIIEPTFGVDGATGAVRSASVTIGNQTSTVNVLQFSQGFDRRRAVDDQLRALKDAGQRLTVRTGTRTVENCVIARYRVERTAEWGNSLKLNLEVKQIRIANSRTVTAPRPQQRRGQRSQNRGGQPGTETSPATHRTFLQGLLSL